MPLLTPHVPSGLIDLMKDLAKEVLRDKPENIYEFAVLHFEKLILERDGSLDKGYEEFSAFEAYFDGQQRFAVPSNYGYICQKPIKIQPIPQPRKSKSDIMASFQAMESINEEDVLVPAVPQAASPSADVVFVVDEKYQNAIYVIQRYFRRYMAKKRNPPNTNTKAKSLSAFTAAIIIQRTMRRLFSNKIKLKKDKDSSGPSLANAVKLVPDDMDNVSEAASYTSSSTIQMLADGQEGRENRLASGQSRRQREEVSDGGYGDGDGDGGGVVGAVEISSMEFKEPTQDEEPPSSSSSATATSTAVVADDDDEEHSHSVVAVAVTETETDRKSIADENGNSTPIPEEKKPHHTSASTTDDTSTAHNIGILSTKIGSNYNHQNLPNTNNNNEIERNRRELTHQINANHQLNIVPTGLSVPLNYTQSPLLGATPDTLSTTSPHLKETEEPFQVHHLEEYANENGKNNDASSLLYEVDGRFRKFDSENGESLKIYDVYYHDMNDQEFSDSLNESIIEKDSLEPEELDADSLESNENVVHHVSDIVKRDAKQDDGSLYGDKNDDEEGKEEAEVEAEVEADLENNDNAQNVQKFIEIERVPTYLYGIHPARTPVVERRNRNRTAEEVHTVPDDKKKYLEAAADSEVESRSPDEKSEEESLESKGSTSEESSATQIENDLELRAIQNKPSILNVKSDEDKKEPTTMGKLFNDEHSNSSIVEGQLMHQNETKHPTPQIKNFTLSKDLKTKGGSQNEINSTIIVIPNDFELSTEKLTDFDGEDSINQNGTNLSGDDSSKNSDLKIREENQRNGKTNQKAYELSSSKLQQNSALEEKTANLVAESMIPKQSNYDLEESLRSTDLEKLNLKENTLMASNKAASEKLIDSERAVAIEDNTSKLKTTAFQQENDNLNSTSVDNTLLSDETMQTKKAHIKNLNEAIPLKTNQSECDVKNSEDKLQKVPSKNEDDNNSSMSKTFEDKAKIQTNCESSLGGDTHLPVRGGEKIEPVDLSKGNEDNVKQNTQVSKNSDLIKEEMMNKHLDKIKKSDENLCDAEQNKKDSSSNMIKADLDEISNKPGNPKPHQSFNSETSEIWKKELLDHDQDVELQLQELQNLNNHQSHVEVNKPEPHFRNKRSDDEKNHKISQHDGNNNLKDSSYQTKELNTTNKPSQDSKESADTNTSKALMNADEKLTNSQAVEDEKSILNPLESSTISNLLGEINETNTKGKIGKPKEDISAKGLEESQIIGIEANSKLLENSQQAAEQNNAFSDSKSEDLLEKSLKNEERVTNGEEKVKISASSSGSPKNTSSDNQISENSAELKILPSTSDEVTKLFTDEEYVVNSDIKSNKSIAKKDKNLILDHKHTEKEINSSKEEGNLINTEEKSLIENKIKIEDKFNDEAKTNNEDIQDKSRKLLDIDTNAHPSLLEEKAVEDVKDKIRAESNVSIKGNEDKDETIKVVNSKKLHTPEKSTSPHDEQKVSFDKSNQHSNEYPAENLNTKDISTESLDSSTSEKKKESENITAKTEKILESSKSTKLKEEQSNLNTQKSKSSDRFEENISENITPESIQDSNISMKVVDVSSKRVESEDLKESNPDNDLQNTTSIDNADAIENMKSASKRSEEGPDGLKKEKLGEEALSEKKHIVEEKKPAEKEHSSEMVTADQESKTIKENEILNVSEKTIDNMLEHSLQNVVASNENISAKLSSYKKADHEDSIPTASTSIEGCNSSAETSADFSSIGKDLEFFEDTIKYLKNATEHLGGMEDVFDAKKNSIDVSKDADKLNDSAVLIQSAFRGYQVRKDLKELGNKSKNEIEAATGRNKRSLDITKIEPDLNDENQVHAAIKIQSAYRGHRVRKDLKDKLIEEKTVSQGNLPSSDSNDENHVKAAIKIQSAYRGHRVRKDLKDKLNEEETKSQQNVPSSPKEDKNYIHSPSKHVLESNLVKSQIPVAVIHPTKYLSSLEECHSEKVSQTRATNSKSISSFERNETTTSSSSKQIKSSQTTSVKANQKNVKTSPQKTSISTIPKPLEKKSNIKNENSDEFKELSISHKISTDKNDQTFIRDTLDQTVKMDKTQILGNRKLTKTNNSDGYGNKSKNFNTKTFSTADLLERPKGTKNVRNQFERKGKSVSINGRAQNQGSFDLETIKKELLSTTFKSPPQSGSKKKTGVRVKSGKQKSSGKHPKGTKIPQKSPSKITNTKQTKQDELPSAANTEVKKPDGINENFNNYKNDLSKTFTLEMDGDKNTKLNLDANKKEANNNAKKPTLNKTYTVRSSLNEVENLNSQLETYEKKLEPVQSSEDLFDSLKKDVDELKANVHEKSAVMIQKTFRGFRTRNNLKRDLKISPNGNLKTASVTPKNSIEISSKKEEETSSENQETTTEDIQKEIPKVEGEYTVVETEKDSSMPIGKQHDPALDKAATTIQKTYRGYKTRKNNKTFNKRGSKVDSNQYTVEQTPKNLEVEPTKIINEHKLQHSNEESTNLEKSALTIQKTFRGYQSRKKLKSKKISKLIENEGEETDPNLIKGDVKSNTQTDSLNLDSKPNYEHKEETSGIFEDLQKSFEGYKNLVLDKSAITIQKHFRGYKVRKNINTKGVRSGKAKDTYILDVKVEGNVGQNVEEERKQETGESGESGINDLYKSETEPILTEGEFKEKTKSVALCSRTTDLEKSATTIQKHFRGYKVRKDKNTKGLRSGVAKHIHLFDSKAQNESKEKPIVYENNVEKRDAKKEEGKQKTGESGINDFNISDTGLVLALGEFKEKSKTVGQRRSPDLEKSAITIQKNFRGYKTRKNLKKDRIIIGRDLKQKITLEKAPNGKVDNETGKSKSHDMKKLGVFDSFDVEEFHNDALQKSATTIQKTFRGYKTRKDLKNKKNSTKPIEDSPKHDETERKIVNPKFNKNLIQDPTEVRNQANSSNKESIKATGIREADVVNNLEKTTETGNLSLVQQQTEHHTLTSKESPNQSRTTRAVTTTEDELKRILFESNSRKEGTKSSSAGAVLENAALIIQKAYRDFHSKNNNHSKKSYSNGTHHRESTPKEVMENSDESSTFIGPDTSFDLSDVESVETKSEKAFLNYDKTNSSETHTPTNNSEEGLAPTLSINGVHFEDREIDNECVSTPQKLRLKRNIIEPTAPSLDEILKAEEPISGSPKLKWFLGDDPIIPSDSNYSSKSSSPASSSTLEPFISTSSKLNNLSSIDACRENLNSSQQLTPSISSAVVSTSSLLLTNNTEINDKNTLNKNSGIVSAKNEEDNLKKGEDNLEKSDQIEATSNKLVNEDETASSNVTLSKGSKSRDTELKPEKNSEEKPHETKESATDLCKNCAEGIHEGGICSEDLIKTPKSDQTEFDPPDQIKQFVLMEELNHVQSLGGNIESSVISSQKEEKLPTIPSIESSNIIVTSSDLNSQGSKNEVPTEQLTSSNYCPAISLIPPSSEDDASERESSLEVKAKNVDSGLKNEKTDDDKSENITEIEMKTKEDTKISLEKLKEIENEQTEAKIESLDTAIVKPAEDISIESINVDLMVDSKAEKNKFAEEETVAKIKTADKEVTKTVQVSQEKDTKDSSMDEKSKNSSNIIEEKEDAFKMRPGEEFQTEQNGFEDDFSVSKNIDQVPEENLISTELEGKTLLMEESKINTHAKKEELLATNENEATCKDLDKEKGKTLEGNNLEIEKSSDQKINEDILGNKTDNQSSPPLELKAQQNASHEDIKLEESTASDNMKDNPDEKIDPQAFKQKEEIEKDVHQQNAQKDETEINQASKATSSSLEDETSTKVEDGIVKSKISKEKVKDTDETKISNENEKCFDLECHEDKTTSILKKDKENVQLQEDIEIAAKLIESSLSDPQAKLLENENKDKLANKEYTNKNEPNSQVEAIIEKLIEDNLKSIEDLKNTVDPKDLPIANASQEVFEEPCVKKVIPPTPYSAGSSDPDESELESTTTKAESTTTTPGYDETSETDPLDIPPSKPDALDAMTEKLREPEEMVARMRQRRASEHKISIDSVTDQQAVFEEPICEPIKPMQKIQKSSSTEAEDEFVLQKLQRGDTTRESSAQSESVVYGDSTSQLTESEDTFNENMDLHPLHRMNTIAVNRNTFKPPSHLFKSVTIDDTVKYIDPEKSTEESGSSFCMDDALSEDVRRKLMAYSISEADSDYYDVGEQTNHPHDDFNISTALDNFPSTDTDTTIVSAATKIQAGARGFLTRRRIRRASMGTKASLTEERNLSFGDNAIGESLDQLAEEDAGRRQFNRQTGVNSLPSALEHSDEMLSSLGEDIQMATVTPSKHSSIKIEGEKSNKMATSSTNDVNNWLEKSEDDSSQIVSNLEATVARRLTLQRGDALRNDSTPDDENGNGKQVDLAKNNTSSMGAVLVHEKTMVESTTTTTTRTTTERRNYSDAAVSNKKEKIKWFALRQNSMPVQIDSEIFRVLPKHMRKRIKSAEGEKPKRIRLPRD